MMDASFRDKEDEGIGPDTPVLQTSRKRTATSLNARGA
jgi:hypothetical protein